MKLVGQFLIIAICAYATVNAASTGANAAGSTANTAVNVVGNIATAAVNAAGNAASAGVNAAGNIASTAVNVAGNVASTAVNAAGNTASAGVKGASTVVVAGSGAVHSATSTIGKIIHGTPSKPSAPTANTCYSNYNTQLNSVNNLTVTQSKSCYTDSTTSSDVYTQNVNSSLVEVNTLSTELQSQLAACAAKTSFADIFNCYVSTFDVNLKTLDDLTIQSQMASSYISGTQTQLEITQSGCINSVILDSKAKSTAALNTLESCLDSVVSYTQSSASNTNSVNSASSSSNSNTNSAATGNTIQLQIF